MGMNGKMSKRGARSSLLKWKRLISGWLMISSERYNNLCPSVRFMATYDGAEMDERLPKLADGKKEHVIICHDESVFHANDHQADYWLWPGEVVLKKKERGRLIMTSGFICQSEEGGGCRKADD